jgi:hypothetical protein
MEQELERLRKRNKELEKALREGRFAGATVDAVYCTIAGSGGGRGMIKC